MTVRDTSLAAFGTLPSSDLDRSVYYRLRDGWPFGCSRRELAVYMDMQASTMSGCINRLIKRGVVKEDGTTIDSETGKKVHKIVAVKELTVQ